MNMRKQNLLIILAVLVVLFASAAIFFVYTAQEKGGQGLSKYSAVYLTSGDIYFGELSHDSAPQLKNVWFLQRGGTGGQQLSILPLSGAFWGPADTIALNPAQILFSARIKSDSPIAKALDNPASVSQLPQQGIPAPQQPGESPPTGK